jgi:hypothetical protein
MVSAEPVTAFVLPRLGDVVWRGRWLRGGVATSGLFAILATWAIASPSAAMEPRHSNDLTNATVENFKAYKAACYRGEVDRPGNGERTNASLNVPSNHTPRVIRTGISPVTRPRRAAAVLAALFAKILH